MTINEFTAKTVEIIFDDTGIDATGFSSGLSLIDMHVWHDLKPIRINPKMVGPLAPMFSAITLTISVAYAPDKKTGRIRYEYSYQHPNGGRNDMTVDRIFS